MTVLDPCRLCRGARVGPGLGLTPHELRHTAASLTVSAGANVKSVQRMLGHASAAMTLDVYAGYSTTTLKMPAMSQNHQRFGAWRNGFRTAGPAEVSMPELSPG